MKAQQSELLTTFYRAFLAFAETGENPHDFTPSTGLCSNLAKFLCKIDADYTALEEMERQFKKAGLNNNYPFNSGSGRNYDLEMEEGRAFFNADRMNWVRYRAQ